MVAYMRDVEGHDQRQSSRSELARSHRRRSGRAERSAQFLARLLAPPALLRTEAAVLMVARVALALVGAGTARCQARLQRIELRWGMRIRLPAEDPDRGDACVRAVEAEADAADHFTHVVLGHACVRAYGAGRLARAALVEASRQQRDIGDQRSRMGSEDVLDAHGSPPGGRADALCG